MKMTKLVLLIMVIAVALFLILPNLSWAADDGAALYKTKCAACHGADLAGKPAAKIPSLISDESKKESDADLTDMIANGGKDKKAMHCLRQQGHNSRPSEDDRVVHSRRAEKVVRHLVSGIAVPRMRTAPPQGWRPTREGESSAHR